MTPPELTDPPTLPPTDIADLANPSSTWDSLTNWAADPSPVCRAWESCSLSAQRHTVDQRGRSSRRSTTSAPPCRGHVRRRRPRVDRWEPDLCGITEIGAVKVRGGEALGEFQTLVNPAGAHPGLHLGADRHHHSMVADAPRIESAFPAFLEFAAGSVLVAHNARFDIAFLKAAGAPRHSVARVRRPRHLVSPDSSSPGTSRRNHKLGSLAPRCSGRDDARPPRPPRRTGHRRRAPRAHRARRQPRGPHARGALELHVRGAAAAAQAVPRRAAPPRPASTSSRTARTALSSDEPRHPLPAPPTSRPPSSAAGWPRWSACARRPPVVCQTRWRPRSASSASSTSTSPASTGAPRTAEGGVGQADPRAVPPALDRPAGPRRRRPPHRAVPLAGDAQSAVDAVHESSPCGSAPTALRREAACALASSADAAPRAPAPSRGDYAIVVADCAAILAGNARPVPAVSPARGGGVHAGAVRGRRPGPRPLPPAGPRCGPVPRLAPLAAGPRVVAARRHDDGGWELVASDTVGSPARSSALVVPTPWSTCGTSGHRRGRPGPPVHPSPAVTEETEIVLRWLEAPGVRIVEMDGSWSCPVRCGGCRRSNTAGAGRRAATTTGRRADLRGRP